VQAEDLPLDTSYEDIVASMVNRLYGDDLRKNQIINDLLLVQKAASLSVGLTGEINLHY
jgi:hypothetical protein